MTTSGALWKESRWLGLKQREENTIYGILITIWLVLKDGAESTRST